MVQSLGWNWCKKDQKLRWWKIEIFCGFWWMFGIGWGRRFILYLISWGRITSASRNYSLIIEFDISKKTGSFTNRISIELKAINTLLDEIKWIKSRISIELDIRKRHTITARDAARKQHQAACDINNRLKSFTDRKSKNLIEEGNINVIFAQK